VISRSGEVKFTNCYILFTLLLLTFWLVTSLIGPPSDPQTKVGPRLLPPPEAGPEFSQYFTRAFVFLPGGRDYSFPQSALRPALRLCPT